MFRNPDKRILRAQIFGRERTLDLWETVDATVYITKRAKLFGSFFQQYDFSFRNFLGSWGAAADAMLSGAPVDSVKHLMHIPENISTIVRAYFSPGARKRLALWYQSTEPLVKERPNINPSNMVEAGLSKMDPTIFPRIDDIAKDIYKEDSWINPRKYKQVLVAIESAMRRGLYDGVYPASMITDLKNNIIPQMIRQHPDYTDWQIMSEAARQVNKVYSVIPVEQSVIQQRHMRGFLQRVFFSFGESEGLLRMAASSVRGNNKRFWGTRWLGVYVGLGVMANIIHGFSTGKPLPASRYVPLSKTQHSWLPIGYNPTFFAPTIGGPDSWLPFGGRRDAELTLDLVGQYDTVFRVLDGEFPMKDFVEARESVPIRALQNQIVGTDFFGAPITEKGPYGIASRAAQLGRDAFAPIGMGEGAIELFGDMIPGGEGLFTPGASRLGTKGTIIKATGLNVRAASIPVLLDRATKESGFVVEMTDPTISGLPAMGEPATEYDHLTPSQKDLLKTNNPELNDELIERTYEGGVRGQESAVSKTKKTKLIEKLIPKMEALVTKYLSDRGYGPNFVPAQARKELNELLDQYYVNVYGVWDPDEKKMVGGIYDNDKERELPEEGSKKLLLHQYYTRFDPFRDSDNDNKLNWEEDSEILSAVDAEFWANLSKEDRVFILENTRLIEREFPLAIQNHLEAKRYAGAYVGTAGGQQLKFWDLPKSPAVINFMTSYAQASPAEVKTYLSLSYEEKKAQKRGSIGERIDSAYNQVSRGNGILARLRKEFIKNAPEEWEYAMLEAGYSFQVDDYSSEDLMESLRIGLSGGDPIDSPDYGSLYEMEMLGREMVAR